MVKDSNKRKNKAQEVVKATTQLSITPSDGLEIDTSPQITEDKSGKDKPEKTPSAIKKKRSIDAKRRRRAAAKANLKQRQLSKKVATDNSA